MYSRVDLETQAHRRDDGLDSIFRDRSERALRVHLGEYYRYRLAPLYLSGWSSLIDCRVALAMQEEASGLTPVYLHVPHQREDQLVAHAAGLILAEAVVVVGNRAFLYLGH